jgi:hypothetical protein
MQKPQPLGVDLINKKVDACRVAVRSGQTSDQTKLDRVFTDTENDRIVAVAVLASWAEIERPGAAITATRRRTRFAISGGRRLYCILALQPVVLDRHVLALNVSSFVEALTECSSASRVGFGPPTMNEADNRH